MRIRMLAIELYRAIKQVEELEKGLQDMAPGTPGRDDLEQKLREAKRERDRIRAMLEGAKAS